MLACHFFLFHNIRAKQEIADLEAAFRRADINSDGKIRKLSIPQNLNALFQCFGCGENLASVSLYFDWY